MNTKTMKPERIAELREITKGVVWTGCDILREALDSLESAQAEIADLKRGGVVVPEILPTEMRDIANSLTPAEMRDQNRYAIVFCAKINAWFRERIQSIPADRVLGEGQAAVGAQELGVLRDFAARRMSEREYDRLEELRDAHERSIRASQGGLNHVHV